MFQNKFTRNLSANSAQLFINQFFGLLIFYALSKGVSKALFGQINWSLAVLLAVFGVLSFGIDQVMVRKIAAGYNRQVVFTAFFFHVLSTGIIFYGLLILQYLLLPRLFEQQTILLLLAIGKLGIFFSTPFKQLATGMEEFRRLSIMSVVSNIVRALALLVLLLMHAMTPGSILIVFVSGDVMELIVCCVVADPLLQKPFKVKRNKQLHWLLLKESLPQTGVVIFTAIMSRLDWILVGLLISSAKLAEYSFAWKAFEVSTMPLLIIAPMMIPMFTRLFKMPGNIENISFFLEWQIMVAAFIALLLNVCWTPLVDAITDGKYGRVNARTIFLLSLSMPLLYANNYLWTINFAKGKLRSIFSIMAISFVANIILCSVLILYYSNEGAAVAYFITLLVQLILYIQKTEPGLALQRWWTLIAWPVTAFVCGYAAINYIANPLTALILAASAYLLVVFISRKVRMQDWKTLQAIYQ